MRIEVGCHIRDADYIRYARTETLKAMNLPTTRAGIEPSPAATYLIAYEDSTSNPIGVTETAMLEDVYGSYEDAPYKAIYDLSRYCPVSEMAGTRTIFVEPEFRKQTATFLALSLATAVVFHDRGAGFATATTSGSADDLRKLYRKCGADFAGRAIVDGMDTALFIFDIGRGVRHPAMGRVFRNFGINISNLLSDLALVH